MNVLVKAIKSRLFSNIFNQTILYGFSHLIPFFLMPFLLVRIGVELYGVIYFAIAFATYFQVVNEFGFDLSNVRHIVNNKNDKNKLGCVVSAITHCKIYLLMLTGILYTLIIAFVPAFRHHIGIYALAFIRLIGVVISPYWFFRSMEDLKYVARISLIVKMCCVLPIFLVVGKPADAIWVMFFFALETFAGGIVGLIVAIRRYGLHLRFVNFGTIVFYLKDSLPFFCSTLITRIYQNSNIVIIGFCCGNAITGIYAASEKLYRAYSAFISPLISYIFYPYFQRIRDFAKINRTIIVICGLNLLFAVILFLLGDSILPIFVKVETEKIIGLFNWFLLLIIFSIPNDILGFPYLGVMGYVKEVNYTTMWSGLVYVALCTILILATKVSPLSLIVVLIITNFVSILLRGLYISRLKRNSVYGA